MSKPGSRSLPGLSAVALALLLVLSLLSAPSVAQPEPAAPADAGAAGPAGGDAAPAAPAGAEDAAGAPADGEQAIDPTTLQQVQPLHCPAAEQTACPEFTFCDQALGICQATECFNEFVAECPLGFRCDLQTLPAEATDEGAGSCVPEACFSTVQTGTGCPANFNCVDNVCQYQTA